MPLYEYECDCSSRVELIQSIGSPSPVCLNCGGGMVKVLTAPAMVRVEGPYPNPSDRKWNDGTAPFTSGRGHKEIWNEGDPREPSNRKQGRKWLSSGQHRGIKRDPEAVYGKPFRKRVRPGLSRP